MKAILFPGQGSQIVGMGSEFYNNFSVVKNLFAEADEELKFKISKVILEGPESDLKLTRNTQPSILLVSYSIFTTLPEDLVIISLYFSSTFFNSGVERSCLAINVCS